MLLVFARDESVASAASAVLEGAVKGSVSSFEGDVTGVFASELEVVDCTVDEARADAWRALDLPAGEASRDSVFRKFDLRFGGGVKVDASKGSLGSL